jgi:hypothetical protein
MGSSHQHPTKRAWSAAAVVAGVAVLMAGCGSAASGAGANASATPSSSAMTSGPPLRCGTVTALRSALATLTRVRPSAEALGQIAADLSSIKTDVEALNGTAAARGAQAALERAVDRIGAAARAAVIHPSGATVSALGYALDGVKASVQPLIAALRAACTGP